MVVAAILWKRLDVEGHDSCRLAKQADGWTLSGRAVFDQQGRPCSLSYEVCCDTMWRTVSALVTGWIGGQDLRFAMDRAESGEWRLNGAVQPQVAGLVDIDLGFTPATNLLALNRHALEIGGTTPSPAAYLSFPELWLGPLDQTYERIDQSRYRYTAVFYGYDEVLEVSPSGFVIDYPKLWRGTIWSAQDA